MSTKKKISRNDIKIVEKLVYNSIRKREISVSDKEVEYFKDHPLELERLTSTTTTKKVFMLLALGFGFILVAVSIILRTMGVGGDDSLLHGLFIELMFECGVALFGASVTVWLLEIALSRQEVFNRLYKELVLKRIAESEEENEGQ